MNSTMDGLSRREFLQNVSFGVASVVATGTLFEMATSSALAQDAGSKKLGFALAGLGNLATNQLAPALQKTKLCRLTGIVTGTPSKAQTWKAKYNIPEKNIYNYDTMERMADNPDIDVVYVVTPNALHAEHTIKAARAGKHVLSEKPMEVSVKKCDEMIDACKRANRKLAIGYRCQFAPHHLEMMRLAREKIFGEVRLIEASFGFRIGDPTQWRLKEKLAGGGALMDVGIYALQACRYIAAEEPIEVAAVETKTDKVKFKEVDESIFWSMKFPSGVMANCGTTYLVGGYNRVLAAADNGWFGLDPAYSYSGIKGRTSKGEMDFPQIDHFAAEMDDFADCILRNRPSKVAGEEGRRDVRILMAVYESIRKGKPVRLT